MRPEIILYDEPTTGVDPIMGDAVNTLIRELHDKLKITSIAVTHDMTSAYKIANKIAKNIVEISFLVHQGCSQILIIYVWQLMLLRYCKQCVAHF